MTILRDHDDEPEPVRHRAIDLLPRCSWCDRPYAADAMTRLLDSRNRPSYRCTSCAESARRRYEAGQVADQNGNELCDICVQGIPHMCPVTLEFRVILGGQRL